MKVAIKLDASDFGDEGQAEITIIRVRRTTDRTAKGPGIASGRQQVEATAEPLTDRAEAVPLRRVG